MEVICIDACGKVRSIIIKESNTFDKIYLHKGYIKESSEELANQLKDIDYSFRKDTTSFTVESSVYFGTKCRFEHNKNGKNVLCMFTLPFEITLFMGLDAGVDVLFAVVVYKDDNPVNVVESINSETMKLLKDTVLSINNLRKEEERLRDIFENSNPELKDCFHWIIEAALDKRNHTSLTNETCSLDQAKKLRAMGFKVEEIRNVAYTLSGHDIQWEDICNEDNIDL